MQPNFEKIVATILFVIVCGTIGMVEKEKIFFWSSVQHIAVADHAGTEQVLEELDVSSELAEDDYINNDNDSSRININIATKEDLMSLPGIGDKLSDEIIDYRHSNNFQQIEDIKNVNGIGEKKFEEISDFICID